MRKGIQNDVTENDGRPVVEVRCFADIEKLKEYKENKVDVRIVMKPRECTDPYPQLVQAMTDLLGIPEKVGFVDFKQQAKN